VSDLLKPDGVFIYVDWRFTYKMPATEELMQKYFKIEKFEDIS